MSDYHKAAEAPLDKILETVEDLLSRKKFMKLEEAVNEYVNNLEKQSFIAGFRFATGLWKEAEK